MLCINSSCSHSSILFLRPFLSILTIFFSSSFPLSNRMDVDRSRLLHQLDKVCEEKDEEIKQLKGLLYEKNVEFDHQINLAKEGKKGLRDEIQDLKNMMAFQKAAADNDVHQLASEKAQLSRCFFSSFLSRPFCSVSRKKKPPFKMA